MGAYIARKVAAWVCGVGVLLWFGVSSTAWGLTMQLTGQIAEDLGSMTLNVTILDASPTLFTPVAGDLDKHLEIYFTTNDANPLLRRMPQATLDSGRNNSFYWTLTGSPTQQPRTDNTNIDVTFSAQVLVNSLNPIAANFNKILEATSSASPQQGVTVNVQFLSFSNGKFVTGGANTLQQTVKISRLTAVPIDAPVIGVDDITPSFRGIVAHWRASQADGKVTYNQDIKQVPATVQIMLFNANGGTTTLPAKQVTNKDTGATAATTCEYRPPLVNNSECIVNCEITDRVTKADLNQFPIYLTSQQPEAEAVIRYISAPNPKYLYTIQGLNYGTTYVMVLQYAHGGKRSNCFLFSPQRTSSLSELNGAPEAELKPTGCFIASAAYGNPLDHHLATLVWFRDQVLEKFTAGIWFVDHYYAYSPAVAAFIAESPLLRTITRGMLWLPALYLAAVKNLGNYPRIYVNGGGLLVVGLWLSLLAKIRRRRRLRVYR